MSTREPSKARLLSPVEAAWVGGFIDGEGYLKTRYDSVMRAQRYVLVVVNTNVEHIATLLRVTQTGTVHCRERQVPHNNVWAWQVRRINDVFSLATQLEPYSVKAQEFLCSVS